MTNTPSLPHHRLIVFGIAREMLVAVRDAHIRDAKLRDEALRSVMGTQSIKTRFASCSIAAFAGASGGTGGSESPKT